MLSKKQYTKIESVESMHGSSLKNIIRHKKFTSWFALKIVWSEKLLDNLVRFWKLITRFVALVCYEFQAYDGSRRQTEKRCFESTRVHKTCWRFHLICTKNFASVVLKLTFWEKLSRRKFHIVPKTAVLFYNALWCYTSWKLLLTFWKCDWK